MFQPLANTISFWKEQSVTPLSEGNGETMQLLENYYTRQLSLKTGEPQVNSESHCVSVYIKIKPVRCLDGALNNRGGHMREEPASCHLHLPGAVGVPKAKGSTGAPGHQVVRKAVLCEGT